MANGVLAARDEARVALEAWATARVGKSADPAPVLAELLRLHPSTAVGWVGAAGGNWSTYTTQVARDR